MGKESAPVKDLIYIALTLVFFMASIILVYALDRLRGGSHT